MWGWEALWYDDAADNGSGGAVGVAVDGGGMGNGGAGFGDGVLRWC